MNAAFVQFDTATIGLVPKPGDLPLLGLWSKTSSASTDDLGINGQQIYLWAFNASTPEAATQQGIFTAFPACGPVGFPIGQLGSLGDNH